LGVGTLDSCVGMFPRTEGGIKVLAGLVPSSQTAGSLFRTPWLAKLVRKNDIPEMYNILHWIYHVHLLITQQHYFAIIGEWFHMGNCTSANVFFVAGKPIIFGHPGVNVIKLFFLRNSWWVKIKLEFFVPCKHYKPGPKFVVKARSLRWRGAPERWSTWIGSLRTRQYKIRLEMLARDKYSGRFGLFVIDEEKRFYNSESWYKILFIHPW